MKLPLCRRIEGRHIAACALILFAGACSESPERKPERLVLISEPPKAPPAETYALAAAMPAAVEWAPPSDDAVPPSAEDMQMEAMQLAARDADPYRMADSIAVSSPDEGQAAD